MKQENRKWIYLGAAALVTALILIFLFLFGGKERIVSVYEVMGTAQVQRQAKEEAIPAFEGMRLEEGDRVSTGEKSSLTMLVDQDKAVRLAENSTAVFAEIVSAKGEQITVIDLLKGTLVNDLKEKLKDNITYEITTPNATISVRGTYFTVYVGMEEGYEGLVTKVNVYSGTVALEHENGEIDILRGEELQGADYIVEWDNGVELPRGNRAIVGSKIMWLEKGVDFSGLILQDLDRLEELTREGQTDLTIEEIQVQRDILREEVQEKTEEITTEEEPGTENQIEMEDSPEPDEEEGRIAEPVIVEVPADSEARADSGHSGPAAGSQEGAAAPGTEKPETAQVPENVTEEEIPEPETEKETPPESEAGGGSDNGSSGESGGSNGSAPGNDPNGGSGSILDQEMQQYKPIRLVIENKAEIEEAIADWFAKKDLITAVIGTSADIQAAHDKVEQAEIDLRDLQTTLDHINTSLDKINALRYPSQIDVSDTDSIQEARASYESLASNERAQFPASALEKLEKCEEALAALTP